VLVHRPRDGRRTTTRGAAAPRIVAARAVTDARIVGRPARLARITGSRQRHPAPRRARRSAAASRTRDRPRAAPPARVTIARGTGSTGGLAKRNPRRASTARRAARRAIFNRDGQPRTGGFNPYDRPASGGFQRDDRPRTAASTVTIAPALAASTGTTAAHGWLQRDDGRRAAASTAKTRARAAQPRRSPAHSGLQPR